MIIADSEHPVYLAAQAALIQHGEHYLLTEHGMHAFQQTLLRYASDPTLVEGLQAVKELALEIHECE